MGSSPIKSISNLPKVDAKDLPSERPRLGLSRSRTAIGRPRVTDGERDEMVISNLTPIIRSTEPARWIVAKPPTSLSLFLLLYRIKKNFII